uniref:Putative glucan endo-1,3-beta-glucosidase-like n=1 Tax=Davidia involucrata TaxID=16924 RepID=A0A5B6YHE1_DAVIN
MRCWNLLWMGWPKYLSPELAVDYLGIERKKITRMRTYDLKDLVESDIKVIVGIPNEQLAILASDSTVATNWFLQLTKHISKDKILYIAVGNEAKSTDYDSVVPAMRNIFFAVNGIDLFDNTFKAAGGDDKIVVKVTTAISLDLLTTDFIVPSKASFLDDNVKGYIKNIIAFLNKAANKAPLLANVYPYKAINEKDWNAPFALFEPTAQSINDGDNYVYKNLFDLLLDAFYRALQNISITGLKIVVAETGWPSVGVPPNSNANTDNAAKYYRRLIDHIATCDGTPFKPGQPIETYLYAMFGMNRKDRNQIEPNYGIYTDDGKHKYPGVPE